ncbi:acyltransferase family protein [Singulisphaera sp. PoT]|uniref:acyltransferase family protein n=1 Tax=Singulisphaera sp. PoT TaxID=3411797 RepID=UPI003BF49488
MNLPESPPLPPPPLPPPVSRRLLSIDAYRGFVMFLMMGEVLQFCAVASAIPASVFWKTLCHHQEHVEWVGCVLHDMIQPSFSFLVGVALPFSLASRSARGQSKFRLTLHAFWRAFILIALGVALRSVGRPFTNYTFEDTLSQIGMGYGFLFLLGLAPRKAQWIALGLILVGYWAAFAFYPLPGSDFDYSQTGTTADWAHNLKGFAAHWNKNTNPAWAFDRWFLNLFPRPKPFLFNGGGYATLSFIPTLGTMILGLLAGGVLRSDRSDKGKLAWLVVAGVASLGIGYGLGALGICPVVKRIWTPSWVLYSGGICFLFMAAFYLLNDVSGWAGWSFPLRVIGMNSIAAYCMSGLFESFFHKRLEAHLGADSFKILGEAYAPLLHGAAVLLILWLILYWMYRRAIFLRV